MLGAAFAALGVLLIAVLPVAALLRAGIAAGWLLYVGRDLAGFQRAWRRYRCVAVDGELGLRLLDAGGNWHSAEVLPGSVVLRRFAWLRIRDDAGVVFAEPLEGRCRESPQWRRLQVIWRHIGAAT